MKQLFHRLEQALLANNALAFTTEPNINNSSSGSGGKGKGKGKGKEKGDGDGNNETDQLRNQLSQYIAELAVKLRQAEIEDEIKKDWKEASLSFFLPFVLF